MHVEFSLLKVTCEPATPSTLPACNYIFGNHISNAIAKGWVILILDLDGC